MEEVQNKVTEKHFCVTLFVHRNWTQQNPDFSNALQINSWVLLLFPCSFFTSQSVQGSGWRTLSQVISLVLCTAADGERSTRPAAGRPSPQESGCPACTARRIMVSALCHRQTCQGHSAIWFRYGQPVSSWISVGLNNEWAHPWGHVDVAI